jgi:hypothetical protein
LLEKTSAADLKAVTTCLNSKVRRVEATVPPITIINPGRFIKLRKSPLKKIAEKISDSPEIIPINEPKSIIKTSGLIV